MNIIMYAKAKGDKPGTFRKYNVTDVLDLNETLQMRQNIVESIIKELGDVKPSVLFVVGGTHAKQT